MHLLIWNTNMREINNFSITLQKKETLTLEFFWYIELQPTRSPFVMIWMDRNSPLYYRHIVKPKYD